VKGLPPLLYYKGKINNAEPPHMHCVREKVNFVVVGASLDDSDIKPEYGGNLQKSSIAGEDIARTQNRERIGHE